ncbi:MAG TPA: alpha/beta hydrolase [Xanthobacteraceae bacterium]|jgi:acetyl esterase/lipase
MEIEDYPPQEPLSEAAIAYQREVMARGSTVNGGDEIQTGPDPYQSLVMFRSGRPNGTTLAFIHGGGWTNGYKEWMTFMAPAFTGAGITFASIGYRLAPKHTFPSGFEDACAGVRWILDNIANYGGKPDRVFVGGHSAGGHYASLLALTELSDQVQGCLPISGVYDFGAHSGLTTRPRFLGSAEDKNEQAASPISNIGERPCPFLLAHGSNDFPHLIEQARRMKEALAIKGSDVSRITLADRNHFTASYAGGEAEGPWVPHAISWMLTH